MKTCFILSAALLHLALPAPASAEPAQNPPEGSAPRSLTLPHIETYRLGNGMLVTLVPHGHVPKTIVRAVVQTGNLDDGDRPGLSALVGDMLAKGSRDRSASAIALAAAAMGGPLTVGVDLDQTSASMNILSEHAPAAIGLIGEILQRPALSAEEFGRAKLNMERAASVNGKRSQTLAQEAFMQMVYPDHPYGRSVLPDTGRLAALTLGEVKAYHEENFGARRTHVYVVGKFDAAAVRTAIVREMGGWKPGKAALVLPPPRPRASYIRLVDRPGAVQSTIRLGTRVPAVDESVDLKAADVVLGGYFSSRITRNLREDKGYSYSPTSIIRAARGAAFWAEYADVSSEVTGPAITEILKEIKALQSGPIAENELRGAKNYMIGNFVVRLAPADSLVSQLVFMDLHGLGTDYLETYVGKVETLTAADIQRAARKHLAIGSLSLAVVGDMKTVRAQLEAVPDIAPRLPAPSSQGESK